jgi:hypothetical protein
MLLGNIKKDSLAGIVERSEYSKADINDTVSICHINSKITKNDSIDFVNGIITLRKNQSSLFFDEFKKDTELNSDIFTLVGTKRFQIEPNGSNEFLNLEVHCRYHQDEDTKQDEFEIIFNDVTLVKNFDKKKSHMDEVFILFSLSFRLKNNVISSHTFL